MTRTLFFLTALAAMLAAMTAVLIRIELAYPGVTALFQTLEGTPDEAKFRRVSSFHSGVSFLAVTLLGTVMASAARTKRAPMSGLFVWLGCGVSFVVFALVFLAAIQLPSADQAGTGWAMYLSLSSHPASLLEVLLANIPDAVAIPTALPNQSHLLMLPAAVMLFLGAYAMLATLPSFKWLSTIGFILVTSVTILVASAFLMDSHIIISGLYLAVALPLLTFASIRLIDTAPSWLMILAIGLIVSAAGQIALLPLTAGNISQDTALDAAILYTFPLGMAFYAFPALILYDRNTDLAARGTALALAGITLPLVLWVSYLTILGLNGMPFRYVDVPLELSANNLITTTNVMFFIGLYLLTITVIRRKTR